MQPHCPTAKRGRSSSIYLCIYLKIPIQTLMRNSSLRSKVHTHVHKSLLAGPDCFWITLSKTLSDFVPSGFWTLAWSWPSLTAPVLCTTSTLWRKHRICMDTGDPFLMSGKCLLYPHDCAVYDINTVKKTQDLYGHRGPVSNVRWVFVVSSWLHI